MPTAVFSRRKSKRFLLAVVLIMWCGTPAWAAEESSKASKKEAPFAYDPKGHRDPFLPLVVNGRPVGWTSKPGVDTSKPVLYGILWDPGGQSLALINDGEYRAGETVGAYQVQEIREDAVVLDNGGEPVVLAIAFDTPPAKLSPDTTKGGKRR